VDASRTLVMADGAAVAYRLWRPGPPRRLVVLVHGLASNHTRWSEFVAMTRLRASWDLLRPDLRGFAESLHRGRVGLDEWSRDLAALIAAEGTAPVVLVGHCLGANVALHVAARWPDRVQGLVLVEPMFREALTGALRLTTRVRPLARGLGALIRGLNALGLHRRHLATLDLEQLDREARAAVSAAGPAGFPEARFGSPREDLRSTPTAVYLAGLLAVTAPAPALASVGTPALALLSSGGRFGDPAATMRRLEALPRCETHLLEARHWIPTESPVAMREAIDAWCGRLAAGDGPRPRGIPG
jgi:pimeloyl-ACP methyl ester carboxylesterase